MDTSTFNPFRFACIALAASFAAFSAGCDYIRSIRLGEVPGTVYTKPKISHNVRRTKIKIFPDGRGEIVHILRRTEPFYMFRAEEVVIEYAEAEKKG